MLLLKAKINADTNDKANKTKSIKKRTKESDKILS